MERFASGMRRPFRNNLQEPIAGWPDEGRLAGELKRIRYVADYYLRIVTSS